MTRSPVAAALTVAVAQVPATVLESAVGHYAAGVAHGLFGAGLPVAGPRFADGMTIRQRRRPVGVDRRSLAGAFPGAAGRLVVFLHGLTETERSWFRGKADFGARLTGDLGASPLYVRYNSGRHISENGRDLVTLVSRLVAAWPVPVTDIVLIGHSMGGLVARSALYQAEERRAPWLSRVTRLVCLGTPHSGAPLERHVARLVSLLGNSAWTAPLTRVLALRSDGIRDLGDGWIHREQWAGAEAGPELRAPPGVRRLFVSATLSHTEGSRWGRLIGDLLVTPVAAAEPTESADVAWLGGLNHFALQHADAVYDTVLGWLRADAKGSAP
ncbi:hypothetical protein VA596_15690 [Amycolatopsis sp., V23-08]|uniref:GPI inositol-deacylase PGAP1-like alpha/beta domain-containing protein n=1 Tax=Amycolatopsis heterodermiae TaxID=3110235 RepID=A0ABU5R443_9PSEU|nr:alpha/beta fold hydrolase [Amycolatopsis sp., V23-08]MEA5360988.1 hypothetical protein [Amycolatopsis sp., V23-08]